MTVILLVILTDLQNIVAASREGKIATLPIFSGWADENIQKFIWWLEIVFLANQIMDRKKFYIGINCLIDTAANWYELNWTTVVNWSTVRQPDGTKLKESLIARFDMIA